MRLSEGSEGGPPHLKADGLRTIHASKEKSELSVLVVSSTSGHPAPSLQRSRKWRSELRSSPFYLALVMRPFRVLLPEVLAVLENGTGLDSQEVG